MKREKRIELLKEFIERDFKEDVICDIMITITSYLDYREKWMEMPQIYEKEKIYWRTELENTFKNYELDFSVGDVVDD